MAAPRPLTYDDVVEYYAVPENRFHGASTLTEDNIDTIARKIAGILDAVNQKHVPTNDNQSKVWIQELLDLNQRKQQMTRLIKEYVPYWINSV